MPANFPYDQYEVFTEPLTMYYPASAEEQARRIVDLVSTAATRIAEVLDQAVPELEILLVEPEDWEVAPHDDADEVNAAHPYLTESTTPPSIVVPLEVDEIFGEMTPAKFAFTLYHEVALACLEADPRPWPEEYPLWADEWQFKLAALWLAHELDSQQGVVNKDMRTQYADIFEPEADGKTPVTVRGFDWFEDTDPEDYLCYELLLEQFADDLLSTYDITILPRFLSLYRTASAQLLSDDVTRMLSTALGPGGEEWLEALVYF